MDHYSNSPSINNTTASSSSSPISAFYGLKRDSVWDGAALLHTPSTFQSDAFVEKRNAVLNQVNVCQQFWSSILRDSSNVSGHFNPRLGESLSKLDKLRRRISDSRSRVLVAGDLNSGKSSFINGLLGRPVVPVDQQPCTSVFAEIMDMENKGYDRASSSLGPISLDEHVDGIPHIGAEPFQDADNNRDTVKTFPMSELIPLMEDDHSEFELLNVYCRDGRDSSTSLLRNGSVHVSLIDSPGLNIDSVKTLNLLSSQEEIDVIVFVVNAENHFTLSAQDFLYKAGIEKGYIFVVVNRWDQIRKKDKCREEIFKQLQVISPLTYSGASSLVHFISAKSCLESFSNNMNGNVSLCYSEDWLRMEDCLRSFILEKRIVSKLHPVQSYLVHTLGHIISVAGKVLESYRSTLTTSKQELDDSSSSFADLQRVEDMFLREIDHTIDYTGLQVQNYAKSFLSEFLSNIDVFTSDIEWHGFFYVFSYAREIKSKVQKLALVRLKRCEDFALENVLMQLQRTEKIISPWVQVPSPADPSMIRIKMEEDHSDSWKTDGVSKNISVGLGDFFDLSDRLDLLKEYIPGALLIASGVFSYRNAASFLFLGRIDRIGRILGTGAIVAGITIFCYALSDLQNVVERKIRSRIQKFLIDSGYVDLTVNRLGRSTRRVLRLSLWDYQNQFSAVFSDLKARRKAQFESVILAEEAVKSLSEITQKAEFIKYDIQRDMVSHTL